MTGTEPSPIVDFKKRLRPRVYSAAIYVVGAFILVQIIALGSVFWLRQTMVKVEVIGPAFKSPEDAPLAKNSESTPLPDLGNLPTPQMNGRLTVPQISGVDLRILKLNEQAREFRRQNDFLLAEAALKRASALDPNYPNTLINFAMLEEARGNNAKALEYWQRVVALGNPTNPTIRLARERATILEDALKKERVAREREHIILKSYRKVFVDGISTTPAVIGDTPDTVSLDCKIRAGNEPINPGKMRIQVFFYEKLPNNDLLPAKIDAKFASDRPSWSVGNAETLHVRYARDLQQRDESRTFYGYLIRLIYDNEVQDEKAFPSNLLTIFPYQPPKG